MVWGRQWRWLVAPAQWSIHMTTMSLEQSGRARDHRAMNLSSLASRSILLRDYNICGLGTTKWAPGGCYQRTDSQVLQKNPSRSIRLYMLKTVPLTLSTHKAFP